MNNKPSTTISLVIGEENSDLKLERFLIKQYPSLNYIFIQKLIRKGKITVNNQKTIQGYTLKVHDNITLPKFIDKETKPKTNNSNFSQPNPASYTRLSEAFKATLKKLKESILYQDQHMLALNKPSGLAVQGGTGLTLHLDLLLPFLSEMVGSRLKLVHRLDKETSGVLLLAKTDRGAKFLFNNFKSREIKKIYHCLVLGALPNRYGIIKNYLSKEGEKAVEVAKDNNKGLLAITKYKVFSYFNNIAYVEVEPETGRNHQIRAHMAGLHAPIIGDYKYGFSKTLDMPFNCPKSQIFLHAKSLYIKNISGKNIVIEASFDQKWQNALEILSHYQQ